MNKESNVNTTETRELRNQSRGGARGTSELRVGNNPKATGASGSSLKSQGEATTRTTGNNKVIKFIVTFIISMKLRSILLFTEIIIETMYLLNKRHKQYHSNNTLNYILMCYYETNTYLTCTLFFSLRP